jgi:hypothetical protein
MKKVIFFIVCALAFSPKLATAKTCQKHTCTKHVCNDHPACKFYQNHSTAFDQLKTLAGSWSGSEMKNGKKMPARVTYHVTGGGSTLLETLFPGTKMEMVSLYSAQGKEVRMVHYCMMGNQPNLRLDSATGNVFHFKFVRSPGISMRRDQYMGGLTLTLTDKNHLTQNWVMLDKGKEKMNTTFNLVRQ